MRLSNNMKIENRNSSEFVLIHRRKQIFFIRWDQLQRIATNRNKFRLVLICCISLHFIAICRMSIIAIVKLYENRESQLIVICPIPSQKTHFCDSLGSVATNCDELIRILFWLVFIYRKMILIDRRPQFQMKCDELR